MDSFSFRHMTSLDNPEVRALPFPEPARQSDEGPYEHYFPGGGAKITYNVPAPAPAEASRVAGK